MDPYQSKYIQMLDRVQRRAARFVVGDFCRKSSVTKMTQELEWESLAERRKTARLCQFYFVHNGESPNTFTKLQYVQGYQLLQQALTTDVYKVIKQELLDIRTPSFLGPFVTGIEYLLFPPGSQHWKNLKRPQ